MANGSIARGFATGLEQGLTIGQQRQDRELRQQQFEALEEHRAFQRDMQERNQQLQQRQLELNRVDQVRQILVDPNLTPQMRGALMDDTARALGVDVTSQTYKQRRDILLKAPPEQRQALARALVFAFPRMQPGEVDDFIKNGLDGGLPLSALPQFVQKAEEARAAEQERERRRGIVSGGLPLRTVPGQSQAAPEGTATPTPQLQGQQEQIADRLGVDQGSTPATVGDIFGGGAPDVAPLPEPAIGSPVQFPAPAQPPLDAATVQPSPAGVRADQGQAVADQTQGIEDAQAVVQTPEQLRETARRLVGEGFTKEAEFLNKQADDVQKGNAERASARARATSLVVKMHNMVERVNRLQRHNGLPLATGPGSVRLSIPIPGTDTTIHLGLPSLAGTDSADFEAALETFKAQIGFQALQEMRELSKTGGALGQVSNLEINLLQNSLEPLQLTQSATQFRDNLHLAGAQLLESAKAIANAYEQTYGEKLDVAPPPDLAPRVSGKRQLKVPQPAPPPVTRGRGRGSRLRLRDDTAVIPEERRRPAFLMPR